MFLSLSCFSLLPHNLLVKLFASATENLFDVLAGLGRSLETLVNAVLSSKFHSTVKVDFTSALELTFVANQIDTDILCSMLLDLFKPAAQIFKGFITCDIISEKNAMSAPVKDPCHRLKRFLTSLDIKIDR